MCYIKEKPKCQFCKEEINTKLKDPESLELGWCCSKKECVESFIKGLLEMR
jgi:hypothetical protein